jgi:hypothetical protein
MSLIADPFPAEGVEFGSSEVNDALLTKSRRQPGQGLTKLQLTQELLLLAGWSGVDEAVECWFFLED